MGLNFANPLFIMRSFHLLSLRTNYTLRPTSNIVMQDCFDDWKRISEDEDKEKETEKKKCLEGLLAKAKPSKTDNRVVYFGMAVPPVAMIGKKYGESMPTLGFLKLVPDLVAIPLATLLGLGVVKYTRVNLKPDEPSQGVTPASSAKIEPSQSGPPDKKKSEETSATSKEVKNDKDRGSSGTS